MTAGDTCTITVTRTDVRPSPGAAAGADQLQSHPAHDHLWARLRGPSIIYVDLNEVEDNHGSWTAEVRHSLRFHFLRQRKHGCRFRCLKRGTTRWMCCGCFPTAPACLSEASATTTISSMCISPALLSRFQLSLRVVSRQERVIKPIACRAWQSAPTSRALRAGTQLARRPVGGCAATCARLLLTRTLSPVTALMRGTWCGCLTTASCTTRLRIATCGSTLTKASARLWCSQGSALFLLASRSVAPASSALFFTGSEPFSLCYCVFSTIVIPCCSMIVSVHADHSIVTSRSQDDMTLESQKEGEPALLFHWSSPTFNKVCPTPSLLPSAFMRPFSQLIPGGYSGPKGRSGGLTKDELYEPSEEVVHTVRTPMLSITMAYLLT